MSAAELGDVLLRVLPVLIFFVAITVVAEIADAAGVFDVAGHWASRAGRHRTPVLWLLFVLVAVACTIVLSLDTTAVLLTPVGLAIAAQLGISPVPFALTTLWIANTASMLLPVSNLTNLLSLHHFEQLGVGHAGYVRLAALPAVAAIIGTVLVLAVLHRRDLRGRYAPDAPPEPHDPTLLKVSAAVCVAVGPLFAVGLSPAWVAGVAAVVLVVAAWSRDRDLVRHLSVPWQMALAVAALFVVIDAALQLGLEPVLASLAGDGSSAAALARVAGAGALAANAANNLPAYIALESVTADAPQRLMALLIGVNVAPLVTPWASLATLLWAQRCRARGVRVPAGSLAVQGLACALVAGGLALAALVLAG
ncbi:arsenite efflux membrane protein ArsB [Pedococcus dokdonensis]|uniref:Arsenite efflux membrane protein ArsB n=1 Tax=Pedococcus dokdonensis TaxID=443156 RepID=A0A1H0PXP1_9MICO|nr:SLC13 family permease [Pedococcus dokdonensis]SDP09258.1 arsenite efflux membrane protein ArsB [Pedococcus dokdonensis]